MLWAKSLDGSTRPFSLGMVRCCHLEYSHLKTCAAICSYHWKNGIFLWGNGRVLPSRVFPPKNMCCHLEYFHLKTCAAICSYHQNMALSLGKGREKKKEETIILFLLLRYFLLLTKEKCACLHSLVVKCLLHNPMVVGWNLFQTQSFSKGF